MFKIFKRKFEFIVLLMVAVGAGPAGAALWQWSTTAGLNGNADPTINWQEGMAPSAVNDSARAMMAAVAINIRDTSGQITSGGSTSALTLTTNTGFPSTASLNGQRITFVAGSSNSAGATLNIDGTGAVPIYIDGVNGPVPAAKMTAGGVYSVTLASSVYRLHDVYNNPYDTPLGSILWSTLPTPPNANFVVAGGQCISTTTYSAYWNALGTPGSGVCSGGFFQIIDLRGRVVAGLDTMPGTGAANRLTSASTGCGGSMTFVGSVCGNGVEGAVIPLDQVPSITSSNGSVSFSASVNSSNWVASSASDSTPINVVNGTGSGLAVSLSGGLVSKIVSVGSASGSVSVVSSGTNGTARPNIPPTIGLIPYLRVI